MMPTAPEGVPGPAMTGPGGQLTARHLVGDAGRARVSPDHPWAKPETLCEPSIWKWWPGTDRLLQHVRTAKLPEGRGSAHAEPSRSTHRFADSSPGPTGKTVSESTAWLRRLLRNPPCDAAPRRTDSRNIPARIIPQAAGALTRPPYARDLRPHRGCHRAAHCCRGLRHRRRSDLPRPRRRSAAFRSPPAGVRASETGRRPAILRCQGP